MSFRTVSPDMVEAAAYKRGSSAQDVLENINYLLGDHVDEEESYYYGDSAYSNYKITIKIEPA